MQKMMRVACVALSAICATSPAKEPADKLADQFIHPPESAKPWTWWHWISGNVSKEGITADLEAMKEIGLGGAQIFTVDQSDVRGPIKFMSPEWRALVKHALAEAKRLHLTISMEGCDGWSESGGPWVTPAESMQKVVWSERQVTGGTKVPLDLPQPTTLRDFYEDIALYAFPALESPAQMASAKVTASDPNFDGTKILTAEGHPAPLNFDTPDAPAWIQLEFPKAATFSSVRLLANRERPPTAWEVQASDNGTQFTKISAVQAGGSAIFAPATARFFRVWRPNAPKNVAHFAVTSLTFSRVPAGKLETLSGMSSSIDATQFVEATVPDSDKIDPKSLVNLTGKHEWDAPAGAWTLIRIGHTSTGATTHPSTAAGLECNKLSATAVTHHIENMFGPVFADSPGLVGDPLHYILLDSWEAGCENWTPKMAADFQKRRGYDLTQWLPALAGKVVGSWEKTQRFLWDYRRTLADLVAEEHYETIQNFAHQHQMGLASEATGDGMPTVADQLLCKKYTDIPMGEFWVNATRETNIDDPKEAACAAHIYGQNVAGAESFTSVPNTAAWKNDPYSLKALGDEEFCVGINRFIFHRYAHQPWLDRVPGMSMGPWGINFERTNTWWEPGAAWISYITRCQNLLQLGKFQADLCYFYGEGVPIRVHHKALNPPLPAGYDYDVCNADVLLHSMTVENGLIKLASGMTYRALVLPATDRMTLPVLKKIESLVKAGATIYGQKPLHSPTLSGGDQDAALGKLANEIWGACDGTTVTENVCGKGKIVCGEPLEKVLQVGPDFSFAQGDFLFIHRKIGDADVYFVSNQQPQEITTELTFRVAGKIPELWHPDSASEQTAALFKSDKSTTTLPLHFDPTGSMFVIFRHNAPASAPMPELKLDGAKVWADNDSPPTTLPSLNKGAVEFDAFKNGTYELSNGSQSRDAVVKSLPKPLELSGPWNVIFPPKLGAPASASFDHLISWTESPEDGVKYFSGTATYQKDFSVSSDYVEKGRQVYLELADAKNLAHVFVNGKDLGVLWKPPFRADITDAVKAGTNHLEIKVTNLWPNRLIGDQKLPEDKRVTWASVSFYKANSPLLPSGLLGPVAIIPAQKVSIPLAAK